MPSDKKIWRFFLILANGRYFCGGCGCGVHLLMFWLCSFSSFLQLLAPISLQPSRHLPTDTHTIYLLSAIIADFISFFFSRTILVNAVNMAGRSLALFLLFSGIALPVVARIPEEGAPRALQSAMEPHGRMERTLKDKDDMTYNSKYHCLSCNSDDCCHQHEYRANGTTREFHYMKVQEVHGCTWQTASGTCENVRWHPSPPGSPCDCPHGMHNEIFSQEDVEDEIPLRNRPLLYMMAFYLTRLGKQLS